MNKIDQQAPDKDSNNAWNVNCQFNIDQLSMHSQYSGYFTFDLPLSSYSHNIVGLQKRGYTNLKFKYDLTIAKVQA